MKEYTKIIKERPLRSGTLNTPDGAICGNGDIAAILGDSDSGMRIHLAKCDMWRACEIHGKGGLRPIGYIDIDLPKELYDNYYVEQRMRESELFCSFKNADRFVNMKLFVSAKANRIYIETNFSDKENISLRLIPNHHEAEVTELNGCIGFKKSFTGNELAFETHCAAGMRLLKSTDSYALYSVVIHTNHDREDFCEHTLRELEALNAENFLKDCREHLIWWESFWAKSDMRLSDPELELNWHASQYFLAITARNIGFAPGIYGNFITTDEPGWKGDYHLNYNYQAPFYHLCSSNHVELTDCYATPLLEFLERGKKISRDYLGKSGTYFPIALGPRGICTEYPEGRFFYERLDLGQKSTAAHSADIMIFRWYATMDTKYAKDVLYPFIKAVGEFWEDYLVFEDGRYVILRDAIHEVPCFKPNWDEIKDELAYRFEDKNPLLTLGLLRLLFKALIDVSSALDIDLEKHSAWHHILDNLSEYPTFIKDGKRVFRYTESGMEWANSNSLCLQHCFPASGIGLSSPDKLLNIARNTFFANDRWLDDNATNSIFPIAARLGINAKLITEKLKENYRAFQLPNLLFLHRGGCLENCSLTASTLNEMALQSYEGIIRIFPVWNTDIDCEYENLRADGAFLVSAKIEKGKIDYVKLTSEKGSELTIQNPYDKACISLNGSYELQEERIIRIKTKIGDTVFIRSADAR